MKFFTCAMLLSIMLVTQVKAEARIRFTEPTSGFFCQGEYFCVEIDSRGVPAPMFVMLEWRDALVDTATWHVLAETDSQEPWCLAINDSFFAYAKESFYRFRACVVNVHGESSYSDYMDLFLDNTAPAVTLMSISDNVTEKLYATEEEISFPIGTKFLYFTFQVSDNFSSWGPSPVYNSGVAGILCSGSAQEMMPSSTGMFTYTYDISVQGIPSQPLIFTVSDRVGCNTTAIPVQVTLQ